MEPVYTVASATIFAVIFFILGLSLGLIANETDEEREERTKREYDPFDDDWNFP